MFFEKTAVLVSTLTSRAVPPEMVILLRCFNEFLRNHLKNLSKINIFALGPHLGPKMDPRWAQDGPKRAQDGPKEAQDGPKIRSKSKNVDFP